MSEDTTLRDDLARERTAMANERTLLSYGRTVLGLIGLAAVFFKFLDSGLAMILGSVTLTVASLVAFWGMRSYRRVAARIEADTSLQSDLTLAEAE